MAQRVTADFVGLYELLKSRTGNSPNNVRALLRKERWLASSRQCFALDKWSLCRLIL